MSTSDVIKKSVLEMFAGGAEFSARAILVRLCLAGVIGVYMFFVYKNQSKVAFYSKDLNITIACLPIIVSTLMIAMQSNIIVSLGMVGALSIVRFRTAVKNPLDLLYLFWSITAGIISGVGLEVLALCLCVVLTLFILLLQLIPNAKTSSIVVLRSTETVEWLKVEEMIKKYARNVKEKSRSVQGKQTEVIYELMVVDREKLIEELRNYELVDDVSFVSHDGEYRI